MGNVRGDVTELGGEGETGRRRPGAVPIERIETVIDENADPKVRSIEFTLKVRFTHGDEDCALHECARVVMEEAMEHIRNCGGEILDLEHD
jgi:hypothetical protein